MSPEALLIFDVDGTLYETERSFVPAVREIFRRYALPGPRREELLPFVGEPFEVFQAWLTEQGPLMDRSEVLDELTEVELRSVQECGALFAGVESTLRRLRERGYSLAVCTNGGERYVHAVLEVCGIADLFHYIRFRRPQDTGKEAMVAELLCEIPHARSFLIGDRIHDVRAGKANGCTVIAVTYGYGGQGELCEADYTIASFPALLGHVDRPISVPRGF